MEIKKVGVVGCGTMGSGIAQVCAQSSYQVIVLEVNDQLLSKGLASIKSFLTKGVRLGKVTENEKQATLSRISGTTRITDFSECDLVIEAASEVTAVKNSIFIDLGRVCASHTILASNTSGHMIIKLAALTGKPDKVLGMHFFNPAQIMRLLELVKTIATSDETLNTAKLFARSIGKEVVVAKDVPGFIVNRLLTPFMINAIIMVENGLATPEDVDKAVTLGLNHPMGPFQLLDFIGIDLFLEAASAKYEELHEPQFAPPSLLKQMVAAGWHGRKTGRGFYQYNKT